jgi:hypothetical protein
MTDSAIGQIILFLTTLGGFIVAAWRENRNRRWAQQDRAEAAAAATLERKLATDEIIARAAAEAEATRIKTESIAESLRVTGMQTAAKLREESRVAAEILRLETERNAAHIRENTLREASAIREAQIRDAAILVKEIQDAKGAAHSAYQEANHVNNKIEALNQRLLEATAAATAAPAVPDPQLAEVVTNTAASADALKAIQKKAEA